MSNLSEESQKLNRLRGESHSIYYGAVSKMNLSNSTFDVLYSINLLGEGCLQKEISECALLNKQTVNSTIRQLEHGGFLQLVPGKGREKNIYLTEAGKRLIREKIDPVNKLEQAAWMELPDRDRQEYLRILENWNILLRKKFGEMGKDGE